jgi:hypothetical protein
VAKASPGSGLGFCFQPSFAAPDKLAQNVGPGGKFEPRMVMASYWYGSDSFRSCGPWRKVNDQYLGFKFSIDGKTHYGWARFNFAKFRGTLTGYAYETTPNTATPAGIEREAISELDAEPGPIQANANHSHPPATLGLLAEGAAALRYWRSPAR